MKSIMTSSEAHVLLANLRHESDVELNDLVAYVTNLEQHNAKLETELKRLKETKSARGANSSAMNSRLKDALRE